MAFQKTMAMSSPVDGTPPPGFGSAPGSAPGASAPGGFGPPGGAPPAAGGFGAPGGSPPAGGGFGAPGGAPPAAGGFGAPPAQPAAQQGFGAPPAQAMAPEKKKSKVIYIVLGCLALSLFACLGTGGYLWWAANNAVDELQDDLQDTLDEAAENAANGAANGSVCTRAQECCTAYVNEVGGMTADQACAGINTPGVLDTVCQTSIDGWRQGLEAMGGTVPASCQ